MTEKKLPLAHRLPYWKTGTSSAESWVTKTRKLIEKAGGRVAKEAFAEEAGRAAFLLEFSFEGDSFRLVWPVLPTFYTNDAGAAKRQAATMLYHDAKARLTAARVYGARAAFLQFLLLPDGRVAGQLNGEQLAHVPKMLTGGGAS